MATFSASLREKITPDITSLLGSKQISDDRFLLYFWSPHYIISTGMSNTIDELSKTYNNILKVDTMQNLNIGTQFRILGTPSVVIINHGEIEKMWIGAKSRDQLIKLPDDTPK